MTVTILVTGASGLIGFRILLAALSEGHCVRYAVRSDKKARIVSSNPAIEKLAPGDRLTPVIIPDMTADGAFDEALKDVTHVIHAGSPVPVPIYEPTTQVYEPPLKITSNILTSALKTSGLKRVVITSSIAVNFGLTPPDVAVTAATRVPLPKVVPSTFDNVFAAYVFAKLVEREQSEALVKAYNPHFSVAHVVPAYVYGRNELALDATMMQTSNSSNNLLMMGITGSEVPFPVYDAFAHIDDVADVHLRVALLDTDEQSSDLPTTFGISTEVDLDAVFDIVEQAFPLAVAEGIFKRGRVPPWPVQYDASETEELLGITFRGFESAIIDVSGQYLEKLGKSKA